MRGPNAMAVAALLLGCVSAIPLDKTGNVAQDNTTAVVNTTDAIHHNKTQHEAPKVIHHLAQEIAQRLGQNLTRHQAQNLAQTKAFNLTQNGAFNHTQKGAHNVTHVGGLNISQAAGFNVSYYGGKRIMCAPALKVIFAHGNQFQNTMGKTGRLSKRIAEKIPGSYAENVEYPASMENPMYIYSVAQGSFAVQHAVEAYHFACPRSLMAVLGYSQGAHVTSNAFCGAADFWGGTKPMPTKITDKVVGVVVMGDPSHSNTTNYRRGTATTNGAFLRQDYTACNNLGERMVSYCDAGDHLCDTGVPMNPSVHPNYVNAYGDEVVDYFVRMYDAAKRRAGAKAHGWNATLSAKW